MLFNSIQFLLFFPLVVCICFLLPMRIRYVWLLLASYFFYMCWNAKYAVLILFSTVVTYLSGIFIDWGYGRDWSAQHVLRWKRLCVFVSFGLNLAILFLFKYFGFALKTINYALSVVHLRLSMPRFDVLLPVGISFYTFQALSYTMDVYRGEMRPERNFFRYALFVSFFPQLVAGPIERSKNLLCQLRTPVKFDVENARQGLLSMAYGLFAKIVVADNIAAVVDPVFSNYGQQSGMNLLLATVLFAVQIYCDFNGYTQIAIGSAKVMGIDLMQNFDTPYFAGSVKEFWRRWHISLTSWFRDYLYIPLGGSRKGKVRKYINTMIVFLCSGLWHGASWHYVIWGGLNGLFIVVEEITATGRERVYSRLGIKKDSLGRKIISWVTMFILVDFAWLFFRVDSMSQAIAVLRIIVGDIRSGSLLSNTVRFLFGGQLGVFGSIQTERLIISTIFIIFAGDLYKYRNKRQLGQVILRQKPIYRWGWYFATVALILIWGRYGIEHVQTQFIYFQF